VHALTFHTQLAAAERPAQLDRSRKLIFFGICVCLGVAPLAVRWIDDDTLRFTCGALLTVGYLAVALLARQQASAVHVWWELAYAFFILALVQLLNNSIPGFIGTVLLHDHPNAGNPFASTVQGTLIVQLVTALIAIVPVVVLTLVSGKDLGSIYARPGVAGKWLLFAVVFFALFYVYLATIPLRPGSLSERMLPMNGTPTFGVFLALSPALLVVSLSNGFEEEFLFRGLFLQKYEGFIGARLGNVLQALIFSVAHAGISYTPISWLFILLIVFPLGLAAGYLMRATRGVLVPGLLHGTLDMAIYLAFLTYAVAS
jgi:membrane protease YdiL (CAAX protease family)